MLNFDAIAEQRIQEALKKGELDNLPGAGRPIDLTTEPLVPVEIRLAHRILKNAGLVPVEVLERRELAQAEAALHQAHPESERRRLLERLTSLRLSLESRKRRIRSVRRLQNARTG